MYAINQCQHQLSYLLAYLPLLYCFYPFIHLFIHLFIHSPVGIDVLSRIRERWGGLLSLLEKEHNLFRVDRIPKNDKVTLINLSKVFSLSHLSSLSNGNGNGSNSNSGGGGGGGNNSSSNSSGSGGSSRLPQSFSKSKESNRKMSDPSLDPQTIGATRCLHVGNVPTNLSELQLMREFEKFGELDGTYSYKISC